MVRDWPVPLSYQRPAYRQTGTQLRMPALVARADFLTVGHFAHFPQFLHIKCQNFPGVFYPFTTTYDPYERRKVSWKLVCTFSKIRKTDRQTGQLYIYR